MFLRGAVAVLVGLVVAVVADFAVNAAIVGSPPHGYGSRQSLTGPWGLFFGAIVGFAAAFVVFYLRLPNKGRRIVWGAVAATSFLLGVVFSMWLFAIGVPPVTSLEGAWIYPTWTALFGMGTFAVIRARRIT